MPAVNSWTPFALRTIPHGAGLGQALSSGVVSQGPVPAKNWGQGSSLSVLTSRS